VARVRSRFHRRSNRYRHVLQPEKYMTEVWPWFAEYAVKAGRTIPVIILELVE
jgi:hypothetical protein